MNNLIPREEILSLVEARWSASEICTHTGVHVTVIHRIAKEENMMIAPSIRQKKSSLHQQRRTIELAAKADDLPAHEAYELAFAHKMISGRILELRAAAK